MKTTFASRAAAALVGAPVLVCAAALAWRVTLLLIAVALGGCAVLPADVSRPASHVPTGLETTRLGRMAAASLARSAETSQPGAADSGAASAFRLLADGREAFDARIALIRRAERTLDVQTYAIADDASGRAFLAELGLAALRGVRVRLLLDDLHAVPVAPRLAALERDTGAQVRLFNPLPQRRGSIVRRVVLSLHAYPGLNHRMHNKLFVADGSFGIVGGRNVGDAYFGRLLTEGFVDLDVIVAGRALAELNAAFDRYWNDELSVPATAIVLTGGAIPDAPSATAADASVIGDALDSGSLGLVPGGAQVVVDEPAKARGDRAAARVAGAHLALLTSATREVLVATPYLLPCHRTLGTLAALRKRGVLVSLLTNSVATTDEPLVHVAYAHRRPALLGTGASLRELDAGALRQRLHAKVAVVDGERAFVGSLNLDPRSATLNTEVGLVLSGDAITGQLARQVGLWRERARDVGRDPADTVGARPQLLLRWLTPLFAETLL